MDSRNRRDGAAIEELGWFNPIQLDKPYDLKEDRILEWLKVGAQPSKAAHGLMKRSGLAHHWHLIQQGLDEKTIEKEMKKWVLTREETLKNKADRADKKAEEVKAKAKADKEAASAAAEEEAPAEAEAPAEEEAPAEAEAPAEEAPAEEAPAEEAPAEEAPAEEAPAAEEAPPAKEK